MTTIDRVTIPDDLASSAGLLNECTVFVSGHNVVTTFYPADESFDEIEIAYEPGEPELQAAGIEAARKDPTAYALGDVDLAAHLLRTTTKRRYTVFCEDNNEWDRYGVFTAECPVGAVEAALRSMNLNECAEDAAKLVYWDYSKRNVGDWITILGDVETTDEAGEENAWSVGPSAH